MQTSYSYRSLIKDTLGVCWIVITTTSCTFQPTEQHRKEAFESDYICSKDDICHDNTITRRYRCNMSQLEGILRKAIKELPQEEAALTEIRTPSHSFYLGMTHRGNGHLYLPVSETNFAAIKIYDSCDDTSMFVPHQASIHLNDINRDGLPDFKIQYDLHHIDGQVYRINRCFLQKENAFCEQTASFSVLRKKAR